MKNNARHTSLLVKLSSISTVFILIAVAIFSGFSIHSVQTSSRETAILMGNDKLSSDALHFQDRIAREYGQLRLVDGDLVGENGNALKYQYELIDKLSYDLDIVATVFIRENNDYRRISTSIVDNTGKRAVDTFLGTGSAAYPAIQAGREYNGQAVILGRDYLTEYKPIFAANGKDVIGILFIGIEMTNIDTVIAQNIAKQVGMIVIIAVLIIVALIGINVLSFTFILLRPLKAVTNMLKELSEGEGDLTKTISVNSKDEIGDLALYFNKTLENIRNLVGTIKYKVNALTNTGYELSVNMGKTSKAVDNISSNFEGIKGLEEKQKEESAEVDNALGNIKENIGALNKTIEDQVVSVNTSSSAIEEMTANMHSVTQTLIENSKNIAKLTEASEYGKSALQAVAQEIQEIAKDSAGLLEINAVMNNIASQTNLLSMNAAIEAAHAGDTGKGFAVVSDEIRKLAELSSKQSKTTATMLKKIKASIDNISKSSDEVLAKFSAIDSGVKTVTVHEANIRSAMEEQEAGGKQILDAVSHLKEITASVQESSEDMSKSGSVLTKETSEFIKISNEAIGGMTEVVSGALKEITSAVSHVTEMSAENNENFEELKGETTKFRTTTGQEKPIILVIDDDSKHLALTKSFLEEAYDVTTTVSCEEALKLLYQGLDPAYILLDLIMPDVNGWDTYERIRGLSNLHQVPIAIFTSSDDPNDLERAKKMEAADYIKKPCKKSDLLDKIKQKIGK